MSPFNIETICKVLEKVLPLNKWEWLILISFKIAYFIKIVSPNLKLQIYLSLFDVNMQLYIKISMKVCFIEYSENGIVNTYRTWNERIGGFSDTVK